MLKFQVLLLSFLPACTFSGSLDLGQGWVSVAVGHLGLSQVLFCLILPSGTSVSPAVVTASFGGGVKANVLTLEDLEQASTSTGSCLHCTAFTVWRLHGQA